MANNVTNELTFSGCTEERFKEILNEIQLDEIGFGSIDFNKIIPEPQGFASDLACLNWRRDHWGTKWNSYGYADGADYNEEECQIRFKTANRNASKVIQELSQKYCDVFFTLRYADDNFGYHTGTKVIAFGETMDEYTPREGTYEAQLLAADIKKIDLFLISNPPPDTFRPLTAVSWNTVRAYTFPKASNATLRSVIPSCFVTISTTKRCGCKCILFSTRKTICSKGSMTAFMLGVSIPANRGMTTTATFNVLAMTPWRPHIIKKEV